MRMTRLARCVLAIGLATPMIFSVQARPWRRHARAPVQRPAENAAPGPTESAPAETPAEEQRVFVRAPLPPQRPAALGGAGKGGEDAANIEPKSADYLAYAAPIEPVRPPLDAPLIAPQLSGDACLAQLHASGVEFESASQPSAPLSGCHIPTPVRVVSVPVSGRRVDLPAKPLLDCAYVLQFADFAARLAAPLGPEKMHAPLVAFDTGPGYECRGRNRVAGARISSHGKGLALDVSGFVFADGRKVVVEGQRDSGSRAYFASLRKGACNWFTTVLGPGSDGYHESHLHFDTETHGRSGAYRICR